MQDHHINDEGQDKDEKKSFWHDVFTLSHKAGGLMQILWQ